MIAAFEQRDAVISECGRYRYDLRRQWGDGPIAVFVMLNPSTADAQQDDPTVRRCRGFATSWGMAGFKVVNLFAYRTPSPGVLFKAHFDGVDIVGPRNDVRITAVLCEEAAVIVAAWGATKLPDGMAMRRDELLGGIHRLGGKCLGKTKDGHPRHPLYVRADQPLVSIR